MTLFRSTTLGAGMAVGLVTLAACGEPFGGITDTISAEIISADTTIFEGDNAVFVAQAVYGVGPGFPTSIQWGVSDESKIRVTVLNDLSGNVVALDTGTAWVYARINVDFLDSARVDVVTDGMVRWRRTEPGGLGLYAAVDSLVRASGVGTSLVTYRLDGTPGPSVANTCNGYFGPSAAEDASIYLTGQDCTRRYSFDLVQTWSAPVGDFEGSVAVGPNGDAVVLHSEGTGPGAVIVSRLDVSTGQELWRDTLAPFPMSQRSSLAISGNGDIYAAWRTQSDSGRLTRITGAGTPRWTIELPAWPRFVGPAISGTRALVTYLGGISVFDSAGGSPLWSRQFSQDDPGAASDIPASAPVVDRFGNVYVQTTRALHSYTADGVPRWTADSLGGGSAAAGVGAPTVLVDTTIVITRGLNQVCGVSGGTGIPRWCSGTLTGANDLAGGVSVGEDRTLFLTRAGGELIALWHNTGGESGSWSTEGGNHGRMRRR